MKHMKQVAVTVALMGGLLQGNLNAEINANSTEEMNHIGVFTTSDRHHYHSIDHHGQDLDGERYGHDKEDGFYRNSYGDTLVEPIPLEGKAIVYEE